MKPVVYLVGAGPGDPSLITIQASDILKKADYVLYDALVSEDILKMSKKDCTKISVGKRKGKHNITQPQIHELLEKVYSEAISLNKKSIVRLKGGDPLLFSRGAEEMKFLEEHSISYKVIPGLTSALVASSLLGLPFTHRDLSSKVVFHTGHLKEGSAKSEFKDFELKGVTNIIYMGVSVLDEIARSILESNPDGEQVPVVIVENISLPEQKVAVSTLGEVSNLSITSPAIIIIGEVGSFLR